MLQETQFCTSDIMMSRIREDCENGSCGQLTEDKVGNPSEIMTDRYLIFKNIVCEKVTTVCFFC